MLIAGKGHEDYQIVGTTKHHFDDREEAAAALAADGFATSANDDGGAAPASRSLEWAARAMGGAIVQAGTRGRTSRARTTTAAPSRPGQLFFAFPGERVDGFDFAAQAAAAGAAGIVVARPRGIPAGCDGVTIIATDDPRRAMGDVARARARRVQGLVVGVTGSNGKTTTKELCAAALARSAPFAAPRELQHRRRPAADHPVRHRE